MNYHTAFAISAAGMDAERLRVDVATLNIANADSVAAPGESGYQAQRVAVEAVALAGAEPFGHWLAISAPRASLEPAGLPPRRTPDAGHPWADAQGFITQPGVDVTQEMVTLMTATRAYEANVVAMNAARSMALKALDIGGTA